MTDAVKKKRILLDKICAFGPGALPVYIITGGLVILTLFRAILTATYYTRLSEDPSFWKLFPIGVRMDLILLCYASILPALLYFLLPPAVIKKFKNILSAYAAIFMCMLVYMEIATFPFVDEFDLRPDQKFLEYIHHVYEVFTTLWKVYKFEIFFAVIVLIFSARHFWKSADYIQTNLKPYKNYSSQLVMFLVYGGFIFLGARSSLGHRPANLSTAAFSDNHLANEFALNSTYSMLYSAYRMYRYEKNPSLMYGFMERDEVFSRIKNSNIFPGTLTETEIPLSNRQKSPFKYDRPPNVVIFLQESMGAVDVGCLKGPDITPNLCKLKDEGLWFNNLYATGTRTVRGIEAVVSSFLPTAARGVVKLGLAKQDFFTAGTLFKSLGYRTNFIYGGMSNFDEMRSFFMGNEFDDIYDEPTFVNPVLHGTWGVSDEDLVRKANEIYKSQTKPFFSLILSTSNHTPYEFPDGRIELYEQPKQTHFNAIKYADYAIGLFMELAKKEDYYKNTIFLIVADHNSHVRGNDLVPISKFHIPALMIGPNVPKMEFKLQSSQIDLLPTVFHFTGQEATHPMVGRNLMSLPEGTKGRSFMQYGNNNAYRIEDDVLIMTPYQKPQKFQYQNERMIPDVIDAPSDFEMAKDALAYAYLPWIVYSEKLYRLPGKPLQQDEN